jgi:hypothetical protein
MWKQSTIASGRYACFGTAADMAAYPFFRQYCRSLAANYEGFLCKLTVHFGYFM